MHASPTNGDTSLLALFLSYASVFVSATDLSPLLVFLSLSWNLKTTKPSTRKWGFYSLPKAIVFSRNPISFSLNLHVKVWWRKRRDLWLLLKRCRFSAFFLLISVVLWLMRSLTLLSTNNDAHLPLFSPSSIFLSLSSSLMRNKFSSLVYKNQKFWCFSFLA